MVSDEYALAAILSQNDLPAALLQNNLAAVLREASLWDGDGAESSLK